MRSNIEHWKILQDRGYFETHPIYQGFRDFDRSTESMIAQFVPLQQEMKVAVIGCGYGRDTAHIAPLVGTVYGIDVNHTILAKAQNYLAKHNVRNFIPVLAEEYKTKIPAGLDLVFSIVVMQHLTRDLVKDYFLHLGVKLAPAGRMVVQFIEDFASTQTDAELIAYEPSVSWTVRNLLDLARESGLTFVEVRSFEATPTALWHWAHFMR